MRHSLNSKYENCIHIGIIIFMLFLNSMITRKYDPFFHKNIRVGEISDEVLVGGETFNYRQIDKLHMECGIMQKYFSKYGVLIHSNIDITFLVKLTSSNDPFCKNLGNAVSKKKFFSAEER